MNRAGPADRGSDTAGRDYRFVSTWRLEATAEEVRGLLDALVDGPDPFVWWPDLTVTGRDDDAVRVEARSGVGYRLRFRLHALDRPSPGVVSFLSDGDLVGGGRAETHPGIDGAAVVVITWTVDTTRRWMRRLAPVLRPVFVVAHALVMRRGRRALERHLRTR